MSLPSTEAVWLHLGRCLHGKKHGEKRSGCGVHPQPQKHLRKKTDHNIVKTRSKRLDTLSFGLSWHLIIWFIIRLSILALYSVISRLHPSSVVLTSTDYYQLSMSNCILRPDEHTSFTPIHTWWNYCLVFEKQTPYPASSYTLLSTFKSTFKDSRALKILFKDDYHLSKGSSAVLEPLRFDWRTTATSARLLI